MLRESTKVLLPVALTPKEKLNNCIFVTIMLSLESTRGFWITKLSFFSNCWESRQQYYTLIVSCPNTPIATKQLIFCHIVLLSESIRGFWTEEIHFLINVRRVKKVLLPVALTPKEKLNNCIFVMIMLSLESTKGFWITKLSFFSNCWES